MNFFKRYKKIFLVILFLAFCAFLAWLLWAPVLQTEKEPGEIDEDLLRYIQSLPEAEQREWEQLIGDPSWLEGLPDPENIIDPSRPREEIITGQTEPDSIASGGVTKTDLLVQRPTSEPIIDQQGNISYYDIRDGKFYQMNKDGELVTMSDKIFEKVVDVTWAPNANKAVIKDVNNNKIIYNFETQKQVSLPQHWDDFSFSPDSNQLVGKSFGLDPNNRWLIVFDDNGTGAKALEELGENADKVYPNWSPNEQMVAMWTRGIDFNRQDVFFVGLNGENFKGTVIEGRGFQPKWSDTGEKLLYSVYSSDTNMNPNLWVVNAEADSMGQNRTNLNLNTWAEKCSFVGNEDIYCAVPDYLETGSGLFPDEMTENTTDSLYHINLSTGAKNMIAIPEKGVNISNVMVNSEQADLYFTDKRTGQLYNIKLK